MLGILLSFLLMSFSVAQGATEILNPEELGRRIGLSEKVLFPSGNPVRVAILDNGFGTYREGSSLLPPSARLIAGPVNPFSETNHGLSMAQIVWAVTGGHTQGPRFYLINTNGFSNFKAAIDFVINEKIDIVLYSQVWSFGGNFDGTGFINAQVTRATRAGVLWINAAGNFGGRVYNGVVSNRLEAEVDFENQFDENNIRIVLTWADFKETEEYNTTKDLDLLIYDSNGKLVASSELIQKGEAPPLQGESRLSSHAREIAYLPSLERGRYRIKIRNQSGNFRGTEKFRILFEDSKNDGLKFEQLQRRSEIMPPADHPDVLTVGEDFEISSIGPTADFRIKPEIIVRDSTVRFSNGTQVRGSSTAAALIAGWAAWAKTQAPGLTMAQLKESISRRRRTLEFPPNLTETSPLQLRPEILALMPPGGIPTLHQNGRLVFLCREDPLSLPLFRYLGATRRAPTDLIVYSPMNRTWAIFQPENEFQIATHFVEFRQWNFSADPVLPFKWRYPF
jgi:hypothetical protein